MQGKISGSHQGRTRQIPGFLKPCGWSGNDLICLGPPLHLSILGSKRWALLIWEPQLSNGTFLPLGHSLTWHFSRLEAVTAPLDTPGPWRGFGAVTLRACDMTTSDAWLAFGSRNLTLRACDTASQDAGVKRKACDRLAEGNSLL